jgi:hypothetical protein
MKLRPGNINEAITEWEQYQSNCHYGDKCPKYYIPIDVDSSKDLYWYMELTKEPASVKHYMIDACTGNSMIQKPRFYLYGENNEGYYGVVNGYNSLPYEKFAIAVKVTYSDGTYQYFYSEIYEREICINFDTVYACYNKNDNGGYDANDIYTGLPTTTILGNPELRYYHNYTIRGLKALYSGKKITYTAINYKPVKAVQEKTATITHEVLPYWYEDFTSQAFAKGVITIDGYQYTITDYSSSQVGDPCCERLGANSTASKTTSISFSCSTDTCNALPCIPVSVSTMDIGVCLSSATFTKSIQVTGTLPIEFEVIDSAGMTLTYNSTTGITISSTPPKLGTIKFKLSNCAGDFEYSIKLVEGLCCDLGVLSLKENECDLGTLSININNPL